RTEARSGVALPASSPRLRADARADAGASAGAVLAAGFRLAVLGVASRPAPLGLFLVAADFARARVLRSAMTVLELAHVIDQCLRAFDRHRVVERGAHAAEHAMALEADQAGFARAVEEHAIERGIGQEEWNIHPGTHAGVDIVAIEAAGAVDRGVEQPGLGVAAPVEFGGATLVQHPAHGQA